MEALDWQRNVQATILTRQWVLSSISPATLSSSVD